MKKITAADRKVSMGHFIDANFFSSFHEFVFNIFSTHPLPLFQGGVPNFKCQL